MENVFTEQHKGRTFYQVGLWYWWKAVIGLYQRVVCHVHQPNHSKNLWLYNGLIWQSDHLTDKQTHSLHSFLPFSPSALQLF